MRATRHLSSGFWKGSALLLLVATLGCQSKRPDNLGAPGGQLQPCPDKPNCVNSQIPDAEHGIEAFAYQGPESFEKLAQIALSQPRTTLVKREGEYLWIEYQSSFFRFVDDLELVAVPEAGKIHVRSASRVGRSDLGVNRKRVETLRSLLGEQAVTP